MHTAGDFSRQPCVRWMLEMIDGPRSSWFSIVGGSGQYGSGRLGSGAVALALLALPLLSRANQNPTDEGLLKGAVELARGDSYRAVLTLKDVAARLEQNPLAKKDLAYTHAHLAWAYLSLNRSEDAQAAVASALKADPDIVVTLGVFPANVVGLFERARRPLASDPEGAGRAALESGRPQEAMLEFLRALHALPSPFPAPVVSLFERVR